MMSGVMPKRILAQGPHLRRNARIERAGIVDVAPTILHLLGMAIPDDMDGQPLTAIFEESDLAHATAHYTTERTHASVGDETTGYTPQEEETVRIKLEGLGYL